MNAVAKSTPDYLSGTVLAGIAATLPNFVGHIEHGWLHVGPVPLPLAVAAVASVAAEYALALGFWIPSLRRATALFGVAFHMILKTVIRISMLDWACITLYLVFLLPFERCPGSLRPTQNVTMTPSAGPRICTSKSRL